MKLSKFERLAFFKTLKKRLSKYTNEDIENGIMLYCLSSYGCNTRSYENEHSRNIAIILENSKFSTELDNIIEFFELLFTKEDINEKGIVFTPRYIAEYIANTAISNSQQNKLPQIIDPACGCGIFLISAAKILLKQTKKPIDTIIENCIYGIDIIEDNVRRCILVLKLLSAKYGGTFETIKPNIVCADSLKMNWKKTFHVKSYDYIIGNPPYVNPHKLNKETVKYLKDNFSSTQDGVTNIYYAFIEKGINELDKNGILSYIIPNNFLTIKSAKKLRQYIQKEQLLKRIIDFGENMVFKPVRTYNCIFQLSKNNNLKIEYCYLLKVQDIKTAILNATFEHIEMSELDKNGWQLTDTKTRNNLKKIENQCFPIKNYIRTGIATLRDAVYLVDKDDTGYYKIINSKKFYIEADLIKPIYKIPDLKLIDNIEKAKRYIIFPYIRTKTEYKLIDENAFAKKYPKTYECLKIHRQELESRDKGKGANYAWYAYGRTQGLNKFGEKLLFPTFANKPKFLYTKNKDALFCNGYAVFENKEYDLDILSKILNSRLMEYYVSNSSYSIQGGYYCYQKKYIERFSLPNFTEKDLSFIRKASKDSLDKFLWELYNLD